MNQADKDNSYNWLGEMSENTALRQYLSLLRGEILFDDSYGEYKDNIQDSLEAEEHPFLSVLIRTQGKREEGLREALLCVLAQSFTDYEVILIAHKADSQGKKLIQTILENQQPEFREKIRYVELDNGTRTTPLNVGFSLARGKYISVFDDDDILFDNWAECFYQAAQNSNGTILHGYAFSQDWENVKQLGYRAIDKPKAIYCRDFNLLWQLINNKCPLMTLAFPTCMFQKLGICFDEQLNIMEDWEYFMRLSLMCGVTDIPEPVAIYRFWKNIETSSTLHSQTEWTKMYEDIRDGLGNQGLFFPKEYSEDIIELLKKKYEIESLDDSKEKARLYYSTGEPFNDEMVVYAASDCEYPEFNYWFPVKARTKQIKALRFDLRNDGLFILESIYIGVHYKNGEIVEVPLKKCAHTGLDVFGQLFFLHSNPEIVWEVEKEGYIDCVHISGKISRKVTRTSLKYRLLELIFGHKFFKVNRKFHKKGWF